MNRQGAEVAGLMMCDVSAFDSDSSINFGRDLELLSACYSRLSWGGGTMRTKG